MVRRIGDVCYSEPHVCGSHGLHDPTWFVLRILASAFTLSDGQQKQADGCVLVPIRQLEVGDSETLLSWKLMRSSHPRTKEGRMVWKTDWTHTVTPNYYVPLADILNHLSNLFWCYLSGFPSRSRISATGSYR